MVRNIFDAPMVGTTVDTAASHALPPTQKESALLSGLRNNVAGLSSPAHQPHRNLHNTQEKKLIDILCHRNLAHVANAPRYRLHSPSHKATAAGQPDQMPPRPRAKTKPGPAATVTGGHNALMSELKAKFAQQKLEQHHDSGDASTVNPPPVEPPNTTAGSAPATPPPPPPPPSPTAQSRAPQQPAAVTTSGQGYTFLAELKAKFAQQKQEQHHDSGDASTVASSPARPHRATRDPATHIPAPPPPPAAQSPGQQPVVSAQTTGNMGRVLAELKEKFAQENQEQHHDSGDASTVDPSLAQPGGNRATGNAATNIPPPPPPPPATQSPARQQMEPTAAASGQTRPLEKAQRIATGSATSKEPAPKPAKKQGGANPAKKSSSGGFRRAGRYLMNGLSWLRNLLTTRKNSSSRKPGAEKTEPVHFPR